MSFNIGFTVALLAATLANCSFAGGLTDTLDLSSVASVRDHRFTQQGQVARRVVGDMVGQHMARRMAVIVGSESTISFQLRVTPGRPVTLEFEEMYGRDTLVRGYSVLVDGKPAFFRTWQGCGAGPVHFFVQAPAARKETISVSLRNRGAAPFAISRVWAFSDFSGYFADNKLAVPYYIAPLVTPSFADMAADLEAVTAVKRSMAGQPNAKPAFTVAIAYASFGAGEVKRRVEYVLALARRSGIPVQLVFDTWWAQTPGGMDGAGGFWSDVKYQQVVYNATTKRYQLSVPNQWSSTPWYTTNNPRLNAYKCRRLKEAMGLLRQALWQTKAGPLLLALNLDNEPVYWANGNAGLGENLLQADFNPSAVADARRNGVRLDPTDGLSFAERKWLHGNLVRYNGMIADAAYEGLGTASTSNDLLRNNVYTQAMVGAPDLQYPMLNAAYPFWETAAPSRARAGGEWNGDSQVEREAVMHQIALGRNAAVNAECGNNAANMQSVRPGYALGQRYVTLYNYPGDKMNVAASEIRDLKTPFKAFVYQPVVREERFAGEGWKTRAVEYGGLQSGVIGNTAAIAIWPAATTTPGFITWTLTSPGAPWKSLSLELEGRAFNYGKQDPAVNVRVLAGPSRDPASMVEVHRFHDGTISATDRVDLTRAAKGRKTVFVRLEFYASTIPDNVLSWCSVWKARFTTGWPPDAMKGMPQDISLATVRKQSLLVSWRADAEAAISDLRSARLSVTAATKALQRGAYAEAYGTAVRSLSAVQANSQPARIPRTPTRIAGVFAGLASGTGQFLLNGNDGIEIVRTDGETIIGKSGAAIDIKNLHLGDALLVEYRIDGVAKTVSVTSTVILGVVKSFRQVTPYEMPTVELESGERYVVNMDAVMHTAGLNAAIKSIPLGEVNLRPGDRVRMRVGGLNRAYEVWKLDE